MAVSGFAVLRDTPKQHWLLLVNVALSAAAALFLLAQDNPLVVSEWQAGASLVNVTVALIGLWLPTARALALIGGIAVAEAVILIARGTYTNELVPWENDVMYPMYAIVIGFSASVVRASLERAYLESHEAYQRTQSAQRETQIAQAAESYLRTREVRIHEVVLNTITALARGGLNSVSADTVRLRAQEAGEVLSELIPPQVHPGNFPPGSMSEILHDLVQRANVEGVHIRVSGSLPASLPDDAREMLVDAAREAVLNALTHSDAQNISVTLRERSKGLRLVVQDDGRGFDPASKTLGFGFTSVLGDAVTAAFGRMILETSPGSGCTVTVEWQGTGARLEDDLLIHERTAVLRPVLGIFYFFALVSTVVTFPRIVNPLEILASLLGLLIVSAILVLLVRRDQLNAWWSVLLAAGGAGIYALQSMSVVSEDSTWGEWGSEAASVVMFSIAVAGPRFIWPLVIVIWLVVQGDVLNEVIAPGTIFIAVGALLGEILRRAARRSFEQQEQARESEVRLAAVESVVARLNARQEILQHAGTVDLLARISSGESQWNDAALRSMWTRHDRYLRSTLRLDPIQNTFHEFLASVIVRAWDAGIDLDIALTNWDTDVDVSTHARDAAGTLIDHLPQGTSGRCTMADEGGYVVVRLVFNSLNSPLTALEELPGYAAFLDYIEVDIPGGTVMWECRAPLVVSE